MIDLFLFFTRREMKTLETDVTSFCILIDNDLPKKDDEMKREDVVIYGCVIIGVGVGLIIDQAFAGVLIGLGTGYLLKPFIRK